MARLRPGWRIAVVITFALASCGAPAAVSSPPPSCALDCAPGAGAPHAQVFVEPDAGAAPVLAAIAGATGSLELEIYLLSDTSVIQALEEAANRGVDVRVLLEYAPFGDAGTAAQITAAKLTAAGVHVKRSNPTFRYTHEKALVVDQATAYIMSCNLTRSGLGGSSSAVDRDYGVIDTDPQDVSEIATIFDADWGRTTPTLSAPNLVVSPSNARAKLLQVIASATTSLKLEDEEMQDPASEDALLVAARRGVAVEVVVPTPGRGTPISTDLTRLAQGGVHIRYSAPLYMHAKLILVDGARAFVGSENFSPTSLDANRELGIVLADPAAIATLSAAFERDWSTGTAFPS